MEKTTIELAKERLTKLEYPNIQHISISHTETDTELIVTFHIIDGIFAGQKLKTYYPKKETS